jgi:hypothetical protein
MKRSISTLNNNNNNSSEQNTKKTKNENLNGCNLQQNSNVIKSSESLITNIDNNIIYNYMEDLPILFPKKIYIMGDLKQNKNNFVFCNDNEKYVKTYLYK